MQLILARPGQGNGTYIFPPTNAKISLKILIVKKEKKKKKRNQWYLLKTEKKQARTLSIIVWKYSTI